MRRPGRSVAVGLSVLCLLATPAAAKSGASKPVAKAKSAVKAKKTKASDVKTIDFGAQEVEGRMRSPQILYFLRRVRAQFAPRPLGHRSFLLELADTRRSSALR